MASAVGGRKVFGFLSGGFVRESNRYEKVASRQYAPAKVDLSPSKDSA